MRKNVLSLSIAAMIGGLGLAGSAVAGIAYEAATVASSGTGAAAVQAAHPATLATTLVQSADGVGHNLLTPYYSVQEGNGTLLSIVNTDAANGKAVKVRFRGASNSDDVFDFTVLMSPGDVWTANVYKDPTTGRARLFTPDNSCTLPRTSELNAKQFMTDRVYQNDIKETLEGYVEIFNMADIPPKVAGTSATGVIDEAGPDLIANPLFAAIKHTNGKNPCGSTAAGADLPAAVVALKTNPAVTDITDGAAATAAADRTAILKKGLWTPSSGLMGSWTILNQSTGFVSWSANMVAVEARLADLKTAARGRIVFSPQVDASVAGTDINALTADPLLRTDNSAGSSGIVTAAQYDLPDMSTPYLTQAALLAAGAAQVAPGTALGDAPVLQAQILTASLAVKNVMNEYVTNPLISAQTDWVFSMPTRRYAVGVNYAPIPSAGNPTGKPEAVFNTAATQVTAANVSKYFTAANTKMGTAGTSGNPIYQACVETGAGPDTVTAYDQEETSVTSDFVVSPGTAKRVLFCGETSVLSINGTSSLNAKIASKNIDTTYGSGWMNIATPGNTSLGLPVLGHSFVKMTGAVQAGKSTNYSITQEHRYKR